MDITPVIVIVVIIVLVITVALLSAKGIGSYRRRRRYSAWQVEERTQWLARFQLAQSDEELVGRLRNPDKRWVNSETDAAMKEIELARERKAARNQREINEHVVAFYQSVRQAPDVRARWELLKSAPVNAYKINDAETSVLELRQQTIEAYVELLLVEARGGNAKSFHELNDIVNSGSYVKNGFLDSTNKRYSFPNDWGELVVRFFKNPSVELFHNRHDYAPNEILLVATEALRTKNFVVAKLVLAYSMEEEHHTWGNRGARYSQTYWPYREAVGEFLLTELAAMVDAVHVERSLFQETVTIPVTE